MRRHFVSGFPRALLSLGQEKSSGVEIDKMADFHYAKLNLERNGYFLLSEHGDTLFLMVLYTRNRKTEPYFKEKKCWTIEVVVFISK